jgi:dGTPase
MTSVLTGRFVSSAVGATHSRFGTDPMRRYDADLVVPRTVRNQCALLKGMAFRYVMRTRAAEDWYEQQRTILTELVEALTRTPEPGDPRCREAHVHA